MFARVLKLLKILFSACSFIIVFYIILELTYFLSFPKAEPKKETGDPWLQSSRALLRDMALLTLFIIQHSAMASEKFKNLITNLRLQDLSRSIYVTATASVLWVVIKFWQTTSLAFWHLNFTYGPILWLFFGVHCTAWIIIYVATICTDVTELLGLKQIYYSLANLPDPNHRKSYQLKKLCRHMRHPSFVGFFLIFWFFPFMTLDRMLLATILTSYMYIAWNTDGEDYNYQKYMYERKYHELERLKSQ